MTAVPLAGCTGEDTVDDDDTAGDDTALFHQLTTTITELEAQAETDQARIAELEELCCTLNEMTVQYQYGYDEGYEAASGGSDITMADVDAAWQEGWNHGYTDGLNDAGGASISTLDWILDRGSMKCGVKESQYGMGYLDAGTGVRSGLDISYCRAIAAAIGLNPYTDVEYIPASGSDRFDKLASGTIDVLIRTTTWTTSRDADLNADFAGTNFFDGQGILVREDAFPAASSGNSASALYNADICVGIGTTTEGNMVDWFSSRGIAFTSVPVADAAEATAKFIDGSCDAFTGDMSAMVAKKWQLDRDGSMNGVDIWIAQELLSKEPLAAATRDHDNEWNEIVSWVWWGMVTAEEMGITAANAATSATAACDGSDPGICRLLTQNLGLGTHENPLAGDWMQAVLEAAGNYGEAYDDAFCDGTYDGTSGSAAMTGCIISRVGTLNALVSEGGLQYAPPMR